MARSRVTFTFTFYKMGGYDCLTCLRCHNCSSCPSDLIQWYINRTSRTPEFSASMNISTFIYDDFFFFQLRNSPQWASVSSLSRLHDHTQTHNTVGRTPLDEWSAVRRDVYQTTHNIHMRHASVPLAGFEPAIPSKWTPGDASLRPRGHWDRLFSVYYDNKILSESVELFWKRIARKDGHTHANTPNLTTGMQDRVLNDYFLNSVRIKELLPINLLKPSGNFTYYQV
jgi:hypothetical protein